ncbi:MAG: hypothetical protein KDH09_05670, partial [Chrysiogenetes bacterium]|nr:hypothetical protein [Chrysiogenetes bacterium]
MDTRTLARNLLEEFAQTRGPLLRDPAWAVMRAVALAMVAQISRGSRSANLRVMAAGTLGVHTRAARSKRAASKKEWAIASALFADVVRLAVTPADEQAKREALVELLGRHEFNEDTDDFEHYLNWLPTASIFLALLESPAPLQLQA